MTPMKGPQQMQKLYIRGLVRLADHVRRRLSVPLSEEGRQRLRGDVSRAIATVDDLLRKNQLAPGDLPGPTRMMVQSRTYILLASVSLATLSSGCQPTRTIAGFRNHTLDAYQGDSDSRIAEEITDHVADIRHRICHDTGHDMLKKAALNALFDALLVLANDNPDYRWLSSEYETYVLKQVLPPTDRPPVFLYPRATHPHIAEARALELSEESSIESVSEYWLIPAVLSQRALALDPPTRLDALCQRTAAANQSHIADGRDRAIKALDGLSFWLEPRKTTATAWVRLRDEQRFFAPDSLRPLRDSRTPHDRPFSVGLPDSSAIGLSFAVKKSAVAPGFYGLHVLPLLSIPRPSRDVGVTSFRQNLAGGNWAAARKSLRADIRESSDQLLEDLQLVSRSAKSYVDGHGARQRFRCWARELDAFASSCASLVTALNSRRTNEHWKQNRLACRIEHAMDQLLSATDSPAPVLLDDHDRSSTFSFIVAADFQFHERNPDTVAAVNRFIKCANGDACGAKPLTDKREDKEEALNAIREAKFVILAGDLADAAAGNAPHILISNALGLWPPVSPYSGTPYSGFREHVELKRILNDVRKPVFAVPGNHDGMVGFGGLLSFPLDSLAELLNEFRLLRPLVPRGVFTVNDFIPNGIKLHVPTTAPMVPRQSSLGQRITPSQGDGYFSWLFAPRYDGLVEWRWHLGPTNVTFKYRGCIFVGLNSFNLSQPDRAGVGAVVDNWGGGVRAQDIGWLRAMLSANASSDSSGERPSFVFMHHDPRGVTPAASTLYSTRPEPQNIGKPAYDATDAWGNYATLGYGGLGYSPAWGLFLPLITPGCEILRQSISTGDRFTQEWMQGYGGRELADAITQTIGHEKRAPSRVFFGHNDTPRPQRDVEQLDSWCIGEGCDQDQSACSIWKRALGGFTKVRASSSLPIGDKDREPCDAEFVQVIRTDDIGNAGSDHGFVVVTVDLKNEKPPRIVPVALPRGPSKRACGACAREQESLP